MAIKSLATNASRAAVYWPLAIFAISQTSKLKINKNDIDLVQ